MEDSKEQEVAMNNPGESVVCDPATRPPSSPIPAGYSNSSYTVCNKETKQWEWFDPQIA